MTSFHPPTVVAITGGYVVPVASAPIENGTVLIENGVIIAVGASVHIPKDAVIVRADGGWVLPGFIESHGHVGIHEEANGPAGDDTNEMTNPNMAAARAIDAIDIEDEGFRDALSGGVTSVVVKPGSGLSVRTRSGSTGTKTKRLRPAWESR
jgi:imidazolonepropionase-like amidohydrolase